MRKFIDTGIITRRMATAKQKMNDIKMYPLMLKKDLKKEIY